ncbi:uncharacterized protein ColSpa_11229 [Colletotrichum spaethianum]|uniref:Uncharacterized protein n=1 Tax=Colletotrichum spaethianum TaxID=700344 RepID=A0AA37UT18_9PEZI|nr:uncharacterized protein ColSpa_11229 [Colletotrichum spaethianum]GKT51048.1 hypothetical protein ColSpa_11229 [Colletotrichum spaethianum]
MCGPPRRLLRLLEAKIRLKSEMRSIAVAVGDLAYDDDARDLRMPRETDSICRDILGLAGMQPIPRG